MGKILSLHIYSLRKGIMADDFRRRVLKYLEKQFKGVPGLQRWALLRGMRGEHEGKYALLWIYPSRADWETTWGPVNRPKRPHEYPSQWRLWEAFLAPLIDRKPDRVLFTAFEEVDET
jgi:hypothetical protein